MKPKHTLRCFIKLFPIPPIDLYQGLGNKDVGLDKSRWNDRHAFLLLDTSLRLAWQSQTAESFIPDRRYQTAQTDISETQNQMPETLGCLFSVSAFNTSASVSAVKYPTTANSKKPAPPVTNTRHCIKTLALMTSASILLAYRS